MLDTSTTSIGYKNIVLSHNKSILSTRADASLEVKVKDKTLACPVILSNMPSCQTPQILSIFSIRKWPYVLNRLWGDEKTFEFVKRANEQHWKFISISVGVQPSDIILLNRIKDSGYRIDWLTIDVALIYNSTFEDHIRQIRKLFPDVYLIAGNFSNQECVNWLYNLGVDCGKFGIGVSELCRTRQYTGFGSDLMDFSKCVDVSKIDLILDGGITILDEERGEVAYGDVYKALNLGAKWVMSSALFRWAYELVDKDAGYITQYGNSTAIAKGKDVHVEGAVKKYLPAYGIEKQMDTIADHLKSSISYAGISSVVDAYGSSKYKIVF